MRTITRTIHIADDGTEFLDISKCLFHDSLVTRLAVVMGALPVRPRDAASGDYIRHTDHEALKAARLFVLRESDPFVGSISWLKDTIAYLEGRRAKVDWSWASRIISECAPRPLDYAWNRLCCIDDEGREWEQQFFVSHPEKGGKEIQPVVR